MALQFVIGQPGEELGCYAECSEDAPKESLGLSLLVETHQGVSGLGVHTCDLRTTGVDADFRVILVFLARPVSKTEKNTFKVSLTL